jgi:acyl-[acyl carrier protein]--UDP-N-acetylglucosamine O-acyltransferase
VGIVKRLNVCGDVKFNSTTASSSTSTGALVVSGGVGIAGNTNIGGYATIGSYITIGSYATIASYATIGGNLSAGGNLSITGSSTFTGTIDANGGAEIDNIRIGISDNNEIDTSTGNLTIDSAGGTTTLDDNVSISGSLSVNGTTTISGDLRVTGDITAFFTSDQRLKDNITPIEDPLAKVLSISGNNYTWNENSNKEGQDVGVIAQEILEVLPEAVTTRDNGYLAVDYHKLVPLLIEAIKELSQKVSDLEDKLNK